MFTLGVVPYLNAVPLVGRLDASVRRIDAVPSALSTLLAAGEVDAALLPVAEAVRGVGDGFLGQYGITSDGPVASVLLFLRRPLGDVRRILLDPASRSSAAVLRHLLACRGLVDVEWRRAAGPGPDPREAEEDAVLVIGDPALRFGRTWTGEALDLGALWAAQERLPFVYARWTARRGLDADQRGALSELLDRAGRDGVRDREALARAWAEGRGEDGARAARYVRTNVGYQIGPREEAGLARYAAILREAGTLEVREEGHA